MKKRIGVLLIVGLLLSNVFRLAACGGPSLNSIKEKFKEEGYTVRTFSEDTKSKTAGCIDGFSADKKHSNDEYACFVYVLKFNKKDLAEEFFNNLELSDIKKSIKNNVYVCYANGFGVSADNIQAAIDLFDSCFN